MALMYTQTLLILDGFTPVHISLGEFLKKLALSCCLLVGLAGSPALAAGEPHGLTTVPGSFMVTLDTQADRPALRGMIRAFGGEIRYEYVLMPDRINVRGLPPGAEQALANAAGVLSVTPDYVVEAHLAEVAPLIGAEPVVGNGGDGAIVCILDTGINPTHLMFDDQPNRLVAFKDFVNGQGTAYDDNGHGSNVAGIVAGREGLQVGGANFHGVAPSATLYVGKVLDSAGSGAFSDVHAGIEWCSGLAGDSPSPRADVINMSLGGGAFGTVCDSNDTTGTAPVVNAAAAQGVLVVSSSGNEGNSNSVGTPSCASGSMAIGAVYDADLGRQRWAPTCTDRRTAADQIICFSNQWDFLDVVAPGCVSLSADNDTNDTVVGMCGTSQASPAVAGVAALVFAANPGLNAADVRNCINSTALDLGDPGFDRAYGNGRVQAVSAVACNTTCTVTENPEVSCSDGQDNDCDGLTDGADPDCQGGTCAPVGDSCAAAADCCSNKCKGKSGSKTCK